MKNLDRHEGCTLLQQLKANGQFLIGFDEQVHQPFRDAQQFLKFDRVPAFLDTVERVKDGEKIDFTFMRPPYPRQWVEVAVGTTRMGFYVTETTAADGTFVDLLGWIPGQRQSPHRPTSAVCVRFKLDDAGSGTIHTVAPIFDHAHGREANQRVQRHMANACVRVLQTMAAINVGFYEVVDPRENDRGLPRAIRRGFIGQRYHVLTLRDAKAIRSGQKVVMSPGSMPLHTSRGHWAKYGIDGRGLLFGKYAGRYWVPAHARGKAANGVVEKDYRLAAG